MSGYKQPGAKYRYLNGDENAYHTASRKDNSEPSKGTQESKAPPASEMRDQHAKSIAANERVSKSIPVDHKSLSAESLFHNIQSSPVLVLAVGSIALSWWFLSTKV
jgi:hypothetical protein